MQPERAAVAAINVGEGRGGRRRAAGTEEDGRGRRDGLGRARIGLLRAGGGDTWRRMVGRRWCGHCSALVGHVRCVEEGKLGFRVGEDPKFSEVIYL